MWSMHLLCIHKTFMVTPAKDSCKHIIINGKHGTHLAPGKLWKWVYSVLASWEKKHIKCAKNCIYFANYIDMQGNTQYQHEDFLLLHHIQSTSPFCLTSTQENTDKLQNHCGYICYSPHLLPPNIVHNTPTTPLTPPAPWTAVSGGVVAKWFLQLVVS